MHTGNRIDESCVTTACCEIRSQMHSHLSECDCLKLYRAHPRHLLQSFSQSELHLFSGVTLMSARLEDHDELEVVAAATHHTHHFLETRQCFDLCELWFEDLSTASERLL